MLKKIIAAAAASTLAVTALASTASADAAKVEYLGYDVVDYVTVTVKGELKDAAKTLGFAASHPKYKDEAGVEQPAVKDNYTPIEMKITNTYGKDLKITEGEINSEFLATVQDWDIAKGTWGSEKEVTKKGEVAVEAITLAKKKDTKVSLKTDSFGDTTKYTQINKWANKDGEDKSKITTELTMVLTKEQFMSLCPGAIGAAKVDVTLDDDFKAAVEDGGAETKNAGNLFSLSAKIKDGPDADITAATSWKVTDAKVTTKKVIDWSHVYALDDNAADWGRKDLRQFVNGGKVEFVFNNKVDGKDWVDGSVTFTNSNLQNKTVETSYTEETNTLSVELPANFAYSDNTNTYPLTKIEWNIQRKGDTDPDGVTGDNTGMSDAMKDLKIVKVIFTANEKAPDNNSGNQGGLVEDNSSKNDEKPADSTTSPEPSKPADTNSGSNSGDNANPSTGVAVAVAPVALAAAAAAVVIYKKRK